MFYTALSNMRSTNSVRTKETRSRNILLYEIQSCNETSPRYDHFITFKI